MLKSFQIKKLFGQYDYHFDLQSDSSCPGLLFLTGPNGMGKTHILRMIHDLYRFRLDNFVYVPYDEIVFSFESGDVISVSQTTEYPVQDINSDVEAEGKVTVLFDYRKDGADWDEHCVYVYENHRIVSQSGYTPKMEQFLTTDSCTFIPDNRIGENGADVYNDSMCTPIVIASFLSNIQKRLDTNFYIQPHTPYDILHTVEDRIAKINKQLDVLEKCMIVIPNLRMKLKQQTGEDLKHTLYCAEHALKTVSREVELLRMFIKMMNDAAFVDKRVELSLQHGYRIRKSQGGFLKFDQLSSGEKHFFCQMCSLFFIAQAGSLVMIDEPEISYHMMWQMMFAKQIKQLAKLRNLHFLIATHSPEMFGNDFTLTVDLYRQNKALFAR